MLIEKPLTVKIDNKRFVLTVARNGQPLSSTTNPKRAEKFTKRQLDAMINWAQRYNDKMPPNSKVNLTVEE